MKGGLEKPLGKVSEVISVVVVILSSAYVHANVHTDALKKEGSQRGKSLTCGYSSRYHGAAQSLLQAF